MNTKQLTATISMLAVLSLAACETGRKARIKGENEQDLVGNRVAGAAVYDRLIEEGVEKLFQGHLDEYGKGNKLNVAFMMFENRGQEELASWRDHIYELIDTKVNKFAEYETISQRFIDAGLKDAGIRVEQLFLPAKRRSFLQSLEKQNSPADALLFATLTSGRTSGTGAVNQDNYALTMEMIDIASGKNLKETTRLRVERTR